MTVSEESAERSEMLAQWAVAVAAIPSLWCDTPPSQVLGDIFKNVDELSDRPLANGQT